MLRGVINEPEFKPDRRHARPPVRILLVEDDPQFADLLQTQLRRMPSVESRLEVAGTLADALARLKAERFGLVVSDLNLPDSAGLATVEALARAGEQLVIVLTGDQNPALRAGAIECGAYDFLSKDKLSATALERVVRLAAIQARTFASLRESEVRLRYLVKLSTDFYWESDIHHRVVKIEPGVERHPVANLALLGKARWELPYTQPAAAGWAAHRATLEARLPFRDFEIGRIDADGVERWRSISGEPVFDAHGAFRGYRGTGRDITEQKRAEQDLHRFRLALDTSPDMILLIDRAGMRHVDVNTTACRLLGYSREELLAMGPQDILPMSRADIEQLYDRMIADPSAITGMRSFYRCKDGSELPFESTRRVLGSGEGWIISVISRDIRERMAAEAAMRESEARFRSLTELSSDVYWEQDEQYRFTKFSGAAGATGDSARKQMIGKRRWDRHYFNMTEAAWAAHRADLDARRPFRELELGRVNAVGEKSWVSVSGEPMFDDAGGFRGYRGIGKDITARKRAAQVRELEHSVTRSLAEADSTEAALRGAIRAMCETEGWEVGRYFKPDPKSGALRLAAAWGVDNEVVQRFVEDSQGLTYARGVGLSGRVWDTGQPVWVADVLADGRSAQPELHRDAGMHGAFVFPVIAEGATIGVLAFNSRVVRQPDQALMQAIGIIGSQIGQFVQRKQAEEVMRESEARFRSLTRLSSDWYWEQDADFRFVGTSGSSDARGGITPQAHIGLRRWELPGTEVIGQTWDEHRAVLEARQPFRDLVLRRMAGGEVRYVSVAGEPVFDARQRFVGYSGVATDITDKRRGEEALRRFRYAVDATADGIHIVDCESMRLLDVNETACRYLGRGREELLSLEIADFAPGFDREKFRQTYEGLFSGPDVVQRDEIVHRRKDGSLIPIEITRRGVVIEGRRIAVNVVRDITERKRAEERQAAHLRYQERVARFGQAALVKSEPAELVEKAVQAVLEALGAEAVAYLESEPGVGRMTLRAVVGVADASANPGAIACAPGDPIMQAMHSGTRVLTEGAKLPLAWARELRSAALIPVRSGDKVRGVLCACYRQADAFAAEELNFVEATASVLSTALQRIDSEGRLAYLAQFDPLTGLPNRTLLADRFSQMIVQAKRRSSPLGVLFIDLDGFKMVNDTLGHAGGDALLKEAAVRLQSTVRTGDTVARISGDEFAIVLADLARPEDAALVAQKVIDRLAAAVEIHGNEVFVTASVGVALFPGDGTDAEALIGAADAAMYRAKQAGRNGYQFFTAEINQRSRARAQMGSELRRALEREEFMLFYQPKVRLADRRPSGAEALLRWKHPERGTVSPAEFIPVLEETGLIVPVGEWVIQRACKDLNAWQTAGLTVGPVSVNLSARQFRLPDLHERIKALVASAGVDPTLIELEITESQLMQDPDHAIRVMRALCDSGMRIAIDDFGTGYSSLAYLTRFPVGSLKIDRSFVKDMSSDKGDATIVRTIIEMAHTLGYTVIAEGVETEEQATFLRLLRCEQAQGYLFAKPMPAAEFAALLGAVPQVRHI